MATDSENGDRKRREPQDVEMEVLKKITDQLRRLPTNEDRQRVWDYLGARIAREGRIERGEPPAA